MSPPLATLLDEYTKRVVDHGNQPILVMLVAFGLTFGITRFITHSIRTDRFAWLGNVEAGDTHIHHLVWGISLLLVSGLISIAWQPPLELTAVLFGIGAALTLDEFALWLHLEDVYWSEQGRQSIDAVIVFSIISGFMIIGAYPLGIGEESQSGDVISISSSIIVGLFLAYICFRKGKLMWGVIGVYVPLAGLIGAVRLAKPTSAWARKHYGDAKLARSRRRYAKEAVAHPPEPGRDGAGDAGAGSPEPGQDGGAAPPEPSGAASVKSGSS